MRSVKLDYMHLLLVTSYCKELGSFKFADDINVCGTSLVQDPRTIHFPDVPEIQKSVLKYTLFHNIGCYSDYLPQNTTTGLKG